jgi:hypothetical protein
MNPEQKQKILDNAPEGATHYTNEAVTYYKLVEGRVFYYCFQFSEWSESSQAFLFDKAIPLDSLREPERENWSEPGHPDLKLKSKLNEREQIMLEALEVISEEPHINADIRSVLKGCLVVARTALKRVYSLPDENWSEEDERRMDVIGSNGNDGSAYSAIEKRSKYHREIKPGVWVDVYDVIVAWAVSNPALQHLIKKSLQPGERGHKTLDQDMQDIVDSAIRAQQIEQERDNA